jgi:two-component system, LytTR family, response regulator
VSIRVLIVDDEPLARRGIRARLRGVDDMEVIRDCATGREGVAAIRELAPDLVFLDVQMPGLDGFGVVKEIGVEMMPPTVFVTAYDAHALRAFEAHALDYLLKPIDDDRFAHVLDRARRRIAERRDSAVARRLAALLGEMPSPVQSATTPSSTGRSGDNRPVPRDERLLVRDQGRVVMLDVSEIDWIEAEGDHVRLHVAGKSHRLRETMTTLECLLDPARFARIHRSTIVNLARVQELRPSSSREYVVLLQNGTQLKLSRRFRDRVSARFGVL